MSLKEISSRQVILHVFLMGIGVLLVSGGFYALLHTGPLQKNGMLLAAARSSKPKVFPYQSALDGHGVDTAPEKNPNIVAVMIDNSPDVQRQAGLFEARVVYEAPVEGGITRYMALFDRAVSTTLVGPIRSARDYYLDWVEEYGNPLYMHVGGSPEALNRLKNVDFFDANEFRWGSYFIRSPDHSAPHNTFTGSEKWFDLMRTHGQAILRESWDGWKFGTINTTTSSTLRQIVVPYATDYKVVWNFNVTSGTYERSINKNLDIDYLGRTIAAQNIIIQFVQTKIVDDVGRKEIATVGSGDALVIRQGILTRGTWKKETKISRTRFYDSNTNEIVLTPGSTWIQVVPQGTALEITN